MGEAKDVWIRKSNHDEGEKGDPAEENMNNIKWEYEQGELLDTLLFLYI